MKRKRVVLSCGYETDVPAFMSDEDAEKEAIQEHNERPLGPYVCPSPNEEHEAEAILLEEDEPNPF